LRKYSIFYILIDYLEPQRGNTQKTHARLIYHHEISQRGKKVLENEEKCQKKTENQK
jgi:hypothetical protein